VLRNYRTLRSSGTKTRVGEDQSGPRIGCPRGAGPPFERLEPRSVRTPSPPRHEKPTAPTRAAKSVRRRNRPARGGQTEPRRCGLAYTRLSLITSAAGSFSVTIAPTRSVASPHGSSKKCA